MRCPACGARNATTAGWCTQCYSSLAPAVPSPAAPSTPSAPREEATATSAPAASADHERPVRQRADGEVEWRCGSCSAWSPLASEACAVCGAIREGFGPARAPAGEATEPGRLLALSLLLPGLGHLLAGRTGTGLARAVIGAGWLLGGIGLLVAGVRSGSGPVAGAVLLAGAVVVWALTAVDVRTLADGRGRERLDGRRMLWLVVAVTGTLMVALMLEVVRIT